MTRAVRERNSHQPSLNSWSSGCLLFLLGTVVGAAVTIICLAGMLMLGSVPFLFSETGTSAESLPDIDVEIRRGDQPCQVVRGEVETETAYRNLVWVFTNENGQTVLRRNTESERATSYYRSGHYTVHLEAFIDGLYRPVSQEITISCP